MRLVCPECHSNVVVPDDAAGKEATCPNCGKSFPTPARYTATVSELGAGVASGVADAPAAPPGLVPTAPAPVPVDAPAAPPGFVPTAPAPVSGGAAAPAVGAGYTHSCGITISPGVVAWLPATLLTLVFFLTFFPWVGAFAGDTAVYSQRPWGAAFSGSPARNFRFEGTIPSGWIDKARSDWKLLVPFFLFLVAAMAFAWLERVFRVPPPNVPPLVKVWKWRYSIVAGAATLALLFFLWQLANGFGMERAIKEQVAEQFAKARVEKANSPAELGTIEYAEAQALKAYGLEWTTWLYLALLCNVLAVVAVITQVVLDNRGNKPPPKLLLHY
ncbi:MAG TPA: hypothetical protein VGE74_24105 [Gemmata sp.]